MGKPRRGEPSVARLREGRISFHSRSGSAVHASSLHPLAVRDARYWHFKAATYLGILTSTRLELGPEMVLLMAFTR